MARKLYVTDGLLVNGFAYERGDEVTIENERTREQLLDEGRISTTKPSPEVSVTDENTGATITVEVPADITSFSDEEILAAATERGLIGDDSKINYAELTVEELKSLATERELEVTRGDGKKGDPVQADYVAALEAADASPSDD